VPIPAGLNGNTVARLCETCTRSALWSVAGSPNARRKKKTTVSRSVQSASWSTATRVSQ
jgi:hypothetical protein